MSHAWKQSIYIDEQMAKRLIESQHAFQVNSIKLLDEGWDNLVYIVNQEFIFRFPRRELGLDCLYNEINLLPHISSQVSFPLSAPQWVGKPSELYPYPFAGYGMIPGKAVSDVAVTLIADFKFATTLADWLSELHAIPVTEEYAGKIRGDQNRRYNVKQRILLCQENLQRYEHFYHQSGFEKPVLLEIISLLPKLTFQENRKAFLHGDLYSRHVIINPETCTVAGLIDWGDTHVGHPAIDLAVGMIFTKEAFQVFLNAYKAPVDKETINLLLFHAFCHHMSFLPYTWEQNKSHLKHWASMVLGRIIEEFLYLSNRV